MYMKMDRSGGSDNVAAPVGPAEAIPSSHGSARAAPAPRNMVRREIRFALIMLIRSITLLPLAVESLEEEALPSSPSQRLPDYSGTACSAPLHAIAFVRDSRPSRAGPPT